MLHGPVRTLAVASLLVVVLFTAGTPPADAEHVKRIVLPYGLDERWVPVLAGFKVVPDPPACGAGTASGNVLFSTGFEAPADVPAIAPSVTFHGLTSLWHQTSYTGYGTDAGHGGPGRLYFGHDSSGNFATGDLRMAGAAEWAFDVPADTPSYVTFNTKWSGEWLEGYDHMWVEVQGENGRVYIVCTLNPEGRGDPSSSPSTIATCSPYRYTPCPNDMRAVDPLQLGDNVDPTAPHWESRYVQIPELFAGESIKIRLTFDSADGVANFYLGWMVDDFAITDAVVAEDILP